jgi:signal transduction histidine kinase
MHIEMEITYSRKYMRLIIRDDGRGMDDSIVRSGKAGHWGIFGMRERAQQIGAQFNIWTSSEAGTEVEIRIAAKLAHRRVRRAIGLFRLPFRTVR